MQTNEVLTSFKLQFGFNIDNLQKNACFRLVSVRILAFLVARTPVGNLVCVEIKNRH